VKYEDALTLIDEIRKQNFKGNDWEQGFMQDIELRGFGLIIKQRKALEGIYEKAVGGGIYERREK